jgi:carbamoyl-phosphate synthase small subunit
MTATQMGNTGVNDEDLECTSPYVAGFVVHALSPLSSNWRASSSLDAYLERSGVVAIEGVDTRALTRHLRDHGAHHFSITNTIAQKGSLLRRLVFEQMGLRE